MASSPGANASDPRGLRPGDVAPDFVLADQDNRPIRLAGFRGRPVVIMFYPLDFSGTCSRQLPAGQDRLAEFRAVGAELVGISVDSRHAHKAYTQSAGLDYRLLADFHPKGAVGKRYHVYDQERGYHRRVTFVIDPSGVISHIDHAGYDEVPDFEALLTHASAAAGVPVPATP